MLLGGSHNYCLKVIRLKAFFKRIYMKTGSLVYTALVLALLLLVAGIHTQPVAAAEAPEATDAEKPKNLVPGPMIMPAAWTGATLLPTGRFSIVDHISYYEGKPYKGSSRHTNRNAAGAKAGAKGNEMFTNTFKLRYGLAWNRLDIRTATPFVNNDISRHSPKKGTWKGGLGDTTVTLRYLVKARTDDSPFAFAVDLGTILPTGHTGDKNKYTATNAWAVLSGAGFSWIDKNQRVDLDGRYVVYAEGRHDIRPGNYALFHAHYAYALNKRFDVGLESSLRIEEARKVNGKSQKDSYTEWMAGPKVQLKFPEYQNLMIGAAVVFPLYRHYDSSRLAPDKVRLDFRVGIAF